jgi:dihydrofolate reductase
MRVSAIVAMSENRVIGRDNQLPWKISGDLKRFKLITLGHPVIMGRKTFESIGKLLPGRENIIISRQSDFSFPGAVVFHRLEDALAHCKKTASEAFIIGGAEIYRLSMPYVSRIYLTLVHREIEGDTYFPEFPKAEFHEVQREEGDKQGPFPYSFVVLDRQSRALG